MSNEVMTRNSEWMNHIVNHLNRMVDNFERAVMNYRPMLDGERFMTDKELCARLQLSRRTLQDYRHTFATLSLALGIDLYTVCKLLGHKNIISTQVYAKIIDASKRQAIDRFNGVLDA